MINEDTGLIQADIPAVLAFLFEAYGIVPSEEVKQKETDIRTMQFHPSEPLITLYNPVDQLKKWLSLLASPTPPTSCLT